MPSLKTQVLSVISSANRDNNRTCLPEFLSNMLRIVQAKLLLSLPVVIEMVQVVGVGGRSIVNILKQLSKMCITEVHFEDHQISNPIEGFRASSFLAKWLEDSWA